MSQDIFKAKKERILSCFNNDSVGKKLRKFNSLQVDDSFIPDDSVSAERYKVAYVDYIEQALKDYKDAENKEPFDSEGSHNKANQFALEAAKKAL